MARGQITPTVIDRSGTVAAPAQTVGDNVNGHSILANDGRVLVEIQNADGASTHNVTFDIPGTFDGVAPANAGLKLNIPISSTRYIGPFPTAVYNQSDGSIAVDVDSTQLKIRAYRI